MKLRRFFDFVGCITLGLLSAAASAQAQAQTQAQTQAAAFPTRALKIVVPTSPGSGSDTTARYFGEQLAAALGQPVIIDNRPGANGTLAALAVKQAPADGYTLFLATNTHMAVNPVVVKDLSYDAVKDFKPLTGLARGMMLIVVPASSKVGSLAELVSAAKASKQQLNVGSYTAGFHLSAVWLGSVTGTRHVNVPYKGAPEVFNALLGDQLDWSVSDVIAAMPQVTGGRLRALAVSGEVRHPDYPTIPTVKESGYPDYVNYTWTSLYIRAETPETVSTRLVEALQKILASASAKAFIAKIGSDPMPLAPPAMRAFQASETERFRRIADAAGIKPE